MLFNQRKKELQDMLLRYANGTATQEEMDFVEAYFDSFDQKHDISAPLSKQDQEELEKSIWQAIAGKEAEPKKVIPLYKRFRWIAAASVVFIACISSWLMTGKKQPAAEAPIASRYTGSDILPGTYKAKLTLADGKTVLLDSAALGELIKQGNTAVIHQDGKLIYESGAGNGQALLYNTISTGKGETYSLTLADGSIVSLNSASSVRFPVAFTGRERRIEVSGEVYVKVAKNKAQPFIASVKGMEVLALGTAFNINAYDDEKSMQATLVEGSVRVSSTVNQQAAVIKPGQQVAVTNGQQLQVNKEIDLGKVLAWKENKFIFERDELPVIMRQLARWYDVDIFYEDKLPAGRFSGIISRQRNASAVLEMLKATGNIHFRIEGRKMIVSP